MDKGKRRRITGPERRERILDAAHAIVDAEGFHAATPQRIAETAGITRPVIYQQFGDLPGLFVALIDREAERVAADFQAVVAGRRAGAEPFTETFAGVLAAVDAHPAAWRLFLAPPQGAPPRLHVRLEAAQAELRRFLRDGLTAAYPDLPDPEYSARMVQAAGRELLLLHLSDPEAATAERLVGLIGRLTARARR
ncbi:TetR/AcrR family transcriptional regulator [Nocardiopsis protaetiae]|uniref:TetR/AcrR family transcriptional regulator n=1 Tax=Nocardiopsis protaetiae TaxID=3382270 RepID=UPI00387B481F